MSDETRSAALARRVFIQAAGAGAHALHAGLLFNYNMFAP